MEEAVCLAVTGYFETIKYIGDVYSSELLEDIIFDALDKPAGLTWDTWNEYLQLIVDGIMIGSDLMLKDYAHYDYEDVFGIVFDVIKSVFQRVDRRFGQKISDELKAADRAAVYIQTKWRVSIANPEYDVCKRRLEREFKSMQEV